MARSGPALAGRVVFPSILQSIDKHDKIDMPAHRKELHRYEKPGDARYLTFSCYARLPLFHNDAIKSSFVQHLARARERYQFKLAAWVIMPEHVHLLILPARDQPQLRSMLTSMKGSFAQAVIKRWRELDARILQRTVDPSGVPRFWQRGGGYDRNIVSQSELVEKIVYIHANPVGRGLVSDPLSWSWSSAQAYKGVAGARIAIDRID